jgi:transcriptional repressor NrdR
MRCPFCQHDDTRVIDSRWNNESNQIRRRRECPKCNERFNTLESAELTLPFIIKNDGKREDFDEQKLRAGLLRALRKRPVSAEQIEKTIYTILQKLRLSNEKEIPSLKIGEWMMDELRLLDPVAYVRFASVYRSFEDVEAFKQEIQRLKKANPSSTEPEKSGE